MKGLLDYDGYLNRIMGKIMYIVSANLLFILGSIPIITIGASSVAMYTVLIRYMEGEEPDILRTFWTAFRANFKKATALWMSMIVIALTLAMNYYYIIHNSGSCNLIQVIMNLILLLWLVTWVYVIPAMAYYKNSMVVNLSLSYCLAIAHLPRTVAAILLNIIPLATLILLALLSPTASLVLVICGFSLPAYGVLKMLLPIFKHIRRQYGGKVYEEKADE